MRKRDEERRDVKERDCEENNGEEAMRRKVEEREGKGYAVRIERRGRMGKREKEIGEGKTIRKKIIKVGLVHFLSSFSFFSLCYFLHFPSLFSSHSPPTLPSSSIHFIS